MEEEGRQLVHDPHSFAEPNKVRVKHCSLTLRVDFAGQSLRGTAGLIIERADMQAPLTVDTRNLHIYQVEAGRYSSAKAGGEEMQLTRFRLDKQDPILGDALTIDLPQGAADFVLIQYATHPSASGLQWLGAQQTAGKRHPFLYSQNESIHARSWIPLQDSPGVRITYDASITVPRGMTALMSAEARARADANEPFRFAMDTPVPSYLIALAVGELRFTSTGPRTGVYAESSVLSAAAREFADTEKMIRAVERLYGPYRWDRYDLLVMPPSFPLGGMENPLLTFVTPTIIAGDKSLVGLISHELAHSWSGNLVTNATWNDFWLNEGFTTFIENRIQEEVYGQEQALMEQVLLRRELDEELSTLPTTDQLLHIQLNGRDPDEGMTQVPYVKGALLLRQIEQIFGRAAFDPYLKSYFNNYAFQSITTAEALQYLRDNLLSSNTQEAELIPLDQWVFQAGLPRSAPKAISERFEALHGTAQQWAEGTLKTNEIDARSWNTQEWLEFLRTVPNDLGKPKMADLDRRFRLTSSTNNEILDQWLLMAIRNNYEPAFKRLQTFLLQVGRLKYIRPLYVEMMKRPENQAQALAIYAKARSGYHPIAQTALDKVFKT